MQEGSLNLNTYDKPAVYQGKEAWVHLILNLLYMRKGSYPSCPEMGVDLLSYEFEFADNAMNKIRTELLDQIRTYLPDIPVSNVRIDIVRVVGYVQPLLYLFIEFIDRETSVVVASNEYHVIDFAIAV